NPKARHSERRGTSVIQNLPTKSAVAEMFPLASQHFDIGFLISPRLVGMTDSFIYLKRKVTNPKARHSEQRGTSVIQNLPTKSAVAEVFPLTSQHFDSRFLISPRLVGMTDSFIYLKRKVTNPKARHSEQRGTSVIQNLPTKSAVAGMFPLTSQHFDSRFLLSPRLVGITGSFFPP
ncbi:hypothetical protein, partial [Vibrio harveyi]|uniref:hypothetical protein n=1 Tax=Vibrio harveyi TaxID=669 RepID=UPI001ED954DB